MNRIPDGKYLVNIIGYARKEPMEDTRRDTNYGYQFEFVKTDRFEEYNNPRLDKYNFCIPTTLNNSLFTFVCFIIDR